MACPLCKDTPGFKRLSRNTVVRCECRSRSIAATFDRVAKDPTGPDAADVRTFVETLRQGARGRKRAIKASELARQVFGAEHAHGKDRRLRALAHAATVNGIPIASGNAGYFFATAPEELDEVIGRLRSQAMRELERVRKLESLRDMLQRAQEGNVYDPQEVTTCAS